VTWDVLEATVISNFIFGLGHALGTRLVPFEPIGVELTQQTPLDPILGDLLIANARFVRLIEFKRELNKSPKERAKLVVLKRLLVTEAYSRLEAISRKNHWYVLTNFNKWQSSVIVPYLDLETPAGDRDLGRFVEETANAVAGPWMTEEELDDWRVYVQRLAEFCGSTRIGRTTGGLLFTVNAQGEAAYFPFRDLLELAMTPRQVVQSRMALKTERKQKLSGEDELRYTRRRAPRMGL
jgi:hypothetical protein